MTSPKLDPFLVCLSVHSVGADFPKVLRVDATSAADAAQTALMVAEVSDPPVTVTVIGVVEVDTDDGVEGFSV